MKRGDFKRYFNDPSGAKRDFFKATLLKPDCYKGHFSLAKLEMELGFYKSALNYLNKAIKLNPTESELYRKRWQVKLEMGDAVGAQKDWEVYEALEEGRDED